jgi:hypothetical protein
MTIESFIPTIWAADLQENLNDTHIFAQPNVVNRKYEGEIKGFGSSVRINTIGRITISNYTRNTNITAAETLNLADMALVIDQGKVFHFYIDDVDKAQMRADIRADAMKEASWGISETIDVFLATTINTGVDGTGNDITNGTPLTIGQGVGEIDAYGITVRLMERLDVANTPRGGRWLVVPPFFEAHLRLDSRFVSFGTPANRDVARGDAIGRLADFTIYKSNNLPSGASSSTVILGGYNGAVTFAEQLQEMEAYKPEQRFGAAVKGLHVYGAKVTRPENLVAAEVIAGAYY